MSSPNIHHTGMDRIDKDRPPQYQPGHYNQEATTLGLNPSLGHDISPQDVRRHPQAQYLGQSPLHQPNITQDGQQIKYTSAQLNSFQKPKKFGKATANRSAEKFLSEYKFYIRAHHPSNQYMQASSLYGHLEGRAAQWYYSNVMDKPLMYDIDAMYKAFLKRFSHEDPDTILKGYRNRKQKKDESVESYMEDMIDLLSNSKLDEKTQVDYLINGLKPEIGNTIRIDLPEKLTEVEKLATKMELNLESFKSQLKQTPTEAGELNEISSAPKNWTQQYNNGGRYQDSYKRREHYDSRMPSSDRYDRYQHNRGYEDRFHRSNSWSGNSYRGDNNKPNPRGTDYYRNSNSNYRSDSRGRDQYRNNYDRSDPRGRNQNHRSDSRGRDSYNRSNSRGRDDRNRDFNKTPQHNRDNQRSSSQSSRGNDDRRGNFNRDRSASRGRDGRSMSRDGNERRGRDPTPARRNDMNRGRSSDRDESNSRDRNRSSSRGRSEDGDKSRSSSRNRD